MRPRLVHALTLAITVAAALLRFVSLEDRPMHADEAVLADKLGTLIETGVYRYDPAEHHGPALLYLTYVPARIAGAHSQSTPLDSRNPPRSPTLCQSQTSQPRAVVGWGSLALRRQLSRGTCSPPPCIWFVRLTPFS